MNADGKQFRSSLGGFNKDDVNSYLIELGKAFSAKESSLKEEIDTKNEEIERLRAQLAEVSSQTDEVSDLKKQVADKDLAIFDLNESIIKLREEKASMSEDLHNALDAIDALKTAPVEPEKDSEISDKVSKYDELSSRIGDIILQANIQANDLVAKAEADAKQIITDSEESAERSKENTEKKLNSIISDTMSKIRDNVSVCLSAFNGYATDIQEYTKNAMSMFSDKQNVLFETIDSCRESLSNDVSSSIGSDPTPDSDDEVKEEPPHIITDLNGTDFTGNPFVSNNG